MILSASDWIAISGVAATLITGVTTWFISAWATRKALATQIMGYRMNVLPLLAVDKVPGGKQSFLIEFDGEQLHEPMLLSVDIINLGNRAIERPPIRVEAAGATYVIPIYIENPPPGYDELWKLERIDRDVCAVHLDHINPGQVVKAKFFLSDNPNEMPNFKCPMKDLKITEIRSVEFKPTILAFVRAFLSAPYSAITITWK